MKKKDDESRPRNFVKKFADEFCKPSRFKDRKREAKNSLPTDFHEYTKPSRSRKSDDYDRRSRHERHWYENSPVPKARGEGERAKRLRKDQDRSRDYEGELDSFSWMESEEDAPITGKI